MDHTHLLQRGNQAEALLQDPTFQQVLRDLQDQFTQAAFNTRPDQKEAREDCYFQVRALAAIEAELNAWVHQKDQLLQALADDADAPTEE